MSPRAWDKVSSVLQSRWLSAIKEARDLVGLALAVFASVFILLRQPEVEIRYELMSLNPPALLTRALDEPTGDPSPAEAQLAIFAKATDLLLVQVSNQTTQPIRLDYLRLIDVAAVLDYSIDWADWNGLVPSDQSTAVSYDKVNGWIDLPFLSTLPPRSTASLLFWLQSGNYAPIPQVLADAGDSRLELIREGRSSALAHFIERNKFRISSLLVIVLLWRMSRFLGRPQPQED